MQPGNVTFLTAAQGLQRDLEHEVYQILVKLRCAPFFASYVATLKSADRMGSEGVMPLGLKAFDSIGGWSGSFHPVNNGIDFRYSSTNTQLCSHKSYLLFVLGHAQCMVVGRLIHHAI